MSWASMFACVDSSPVSKQEKFFNPDSKRCGMEQFIGQLRQFINNYTGRVNPSLEPGEKKVVHYIKRLNPCNQQKFFCGQKGRSRAQQFTKLLTELLDAKDVSDAQKLKNISAYAFSQYKEAWFDSFLARAVLVKIGRYIGYLEADEKRHYDDAANGRGFIIKEKMSTFLRRVHDTVMVMDKKEEKEIEMVIRQEMKWKL